MQELVHGEWVGVDHPLRIGQILPGRVGTGAVHVMRIGEVPVVLIQQEEEPDELAADVKEGTVFADEEVDEIDLEPVY